MSIPSERMFESTFEVLAWAKREAEKRDEFYSRDAQHFEVAAIMLRHYLTQADVDPDEDWPT